MPADILVVHLVSRSVAGVRSGWDTSDGVVRHEVVSWRESPATLTEAHVVVAHGLAPLVVAQSIVGTGPKLVYRPFDSSRPTRRRLRRGLHADWVAAPTRRIGRATASALGLDSDRVTVFRSDDRAAWDNVIAALLERPERAIAAEQPEPAEIAGAESVAPAAVDGGGPAVHETGAPGVARTSWRSRRRTPRPETTVPDGIPDPGGVVTGASLGAAAVPQALAPDALSIDPQPVDALPVDPLPVALIAVLSELPPPPLLGVGVVDPKSPGHPWWMYRRMEMPPERNERLVSGISSNPAPSSAGLSNGVHSNGAHSNGAHPNGARANGSMSTSPGGPPSGTPPPAGPGSRGQSPEPETVQIVATEARSGVGLFFLGAAILVVVAVCTQFGRSVEGPYLVPLGALFLTLATVRHIVRRRPDEDWVGRWLITGLVAKLVASVAYFHTYHGKGDQVLYDEFGQKLAHAWLQGGTAPTLPDLHGTNFLKWFTGVVYYVFGSRLLTGTFVFGLLAFAGSYLWYRATADSVPLVNRKLYLAFVLFAPSILFWPATVGKEALMQFALGLLALGVSFIVRQRLVPGFVLAGAGGWLVWLVRPHLLALVAIAAGAAYLAGRIRKAGQRPGLLGRPIGIVIIAFLVAFTIGQGAQFLGIKSLSFSSIQNELNQESATTAIGRTAFHKSGNSLNPIQWPSDAVTVFLRPFPWEIQGSLQILASLESAALALLLVLRFKSLRLAFARSRESPFLMFCWVLTGLYAIAFSSFSNFGLLVRERSLVLPALLVLLSVDPTLDREHRDAKAAPEPLSRPEHTSLRDSGLRDSG